MRDNWNTIVRGRRTELRPYQRRMVEKYHGWMEDPWLREMTASERLSLEEELDMQAQWRDDRDKLTFIVFDRAQAAEVVGTNGGDGEGGADERMLRGMVGDVNLFFWVDPATREEAELMVMTAEPTARRRGIAGEASLLTMLYAVEHLGVRRFVVKITATNEASLALYRRLGFTDELNVKAFNEVHLHFPRAVLPEDEERAAAAKEAAAAEGKEPAPGPADVELAGRLRAMLQDWQARFEGTPAGAEAAFEVCQWSNDEPAPAQAASAAAGAGGGDGAAERIGSA